MARTKSHHDIALVRLAFSSLSWRVICTFSFNRRVLFHYNGHGVPRPTASGEIWVFDKNHTEYIPLAVADLKQWLGRPSMVVLDCSAAGVLLPFWRGAMPAGTSDGTVASATGSTVTSNASPSLSRTGNGGSVSAKGPIVDMEAQANQWVQDTIVLAPCSASEVLPMHPDYPADIFTSCLTTPIPMALRWFVRRNPHTGLDFEHLPIPGKTNDRKTPLGELNWIFTAVTDSIAWNVLPRALFQRLFRQDLLVASMFRNFLLADRILRSLNCTPISHPPLPPGMANHPLWQAWDLVCENLLFQLASEGILPRRAAAPLSPTTVISRSPISSPNTDEGGVDDREEGADGNATETTTDRPPPTVVDTSTFTDICISSPFFTEQLTAFEVWLEFVSIHKQRLLEGKLETPEQLPVVLQVLLSQTHRIRALVLLRRFLQLGPWAVNAALSLGIFPYILKLLQSPEYKSLLVSIWASILSFDPSCRVDLLKDGAYPHFVQHVMWGLTPQTSSNADQAQASRERTLAAFCLAVATHRYPAGQAEANRLSLHSNCCALLSSYEQGAVSVLDSLKKEDKTMELHLPADFRLWLILCLANMIQNNPPMQHDAYAMQVHVHIMERSQDSSPDVRAAVSYALGCFLSSSSGSRPSSRSPSMQELASRQGQESGSGQSATTRNPVGTPTQLNAPLIPPPGLSGNLLQPQPSLGLPTTAANFNPQTVGPPHWQTTPANAPPGLAVNSLGQFLAPAHGQHPISLPNAPTAAFGVSAPPLISTVPQAGGFLVGNAVSSTNNSSPPQFLHSPSLQGMAAETRSPMKPSAFEDHGRLELDLVVLEKLMEATNDASVMVRYEAALGMSRAVGKYTEAFVSVASGLVSATSRTRSSASSRRTFPVPRGLERRFLVRFEEAWSVLRRLQHEDPFPHVARVANEVVSVVHEHLLRFRMEVEKAETSTSEDVLKLHPKKLANTILAGIDEEMKDAKEDSDHSLPTGSGLPSSLSPNKPELHELRRVASEFAMAHSPIENAARRAFSADDMPMHYNLPESEFYEWKRNSFDLMLDITNETEEMDPLSPSGSALVYQEWRNTAVKESGVRLAKEFEILAPKAPKPSLKTIESLLEEDEEDEAADQAIANKKDKLKMRETEIIRNNEGKMTSMLAFHPFEDVIMVCSGSDSISLWSTETCEKFSAIENGNPSPSRMTYSTWMNEESSSLFVVGCDDGSIRIWGDMLEPNGEPSSESPTLVSAFYASPMIPGQVGRSGLVCEWQPFNGTLLTGGNSDFVTCWDIESEKQFMQLETNSDACITTMTTAWDFDALGKGPNPSGYRGLGRDVVLAGFSNGAMKIFDLRASRAVMDMTAARPNRPRVSGYSEHKQWIVNCAFTGYGNRYEFISGTTAGEIKAWDIRMSKSVRTFEAHRSGMTTLAVHSKVPLIATGTSSQFIKIFSPDGKWRERAQLDTTSSDGSLTTLHIPF